MLRSGIILGVAGPAVVLTLLVHPMVRQTADSWTSIAAQAQPIAVPAPATVVAPAQAPLPGMRPVSTALSPIRVATAPRPANATPALSQPPSTDAGEPAPVRPRRMREGCEGALSSLVGPEARRMVPGRCIA
ncbi:hypothetical protein U8607_11785 [Methylobacterium durans]|uniref:hypothetical protein n=1 Tax=Methylobacterium durans TaxID=2202825 RepID=UPI002AFDD88D|nr:hypothetical protein [Methylobacterium durans]MEA1832764.1 hypothetical protein [Methylobacterium durans]